MLYKPKYCCHCGEKIERANWSFRSSRRFCELCETDFVLQEWLPKIFVGLMAVVGIWGFGGWLQKSNKAEHAQAKPILITASNSNKNSGNSSANPVDKANSNFQPSVPANNLAGAQSGAKTPAPAPVLQAPVKRAETADVAFYCGAQTKKGTPCSRRVKGGGRCWQHAGQPPMLPPEQLIIVP